MKEKRELYRRKMEKTIYTDIIAELEEAIVLSNSGKEKESNDAVNAIKEKLEKRIYEIEKMKEGILIKYFFRIMERYLLQMTKYVYGSFKKARKMIT